MHVDPSKVELALLGTAFASRRALADWRTSIIGPPQKSRYVVITAAAILAVGDFTVFGHGEYGIWLCEAVMGPESDPALHDPDRLVNASRRLGLHIYHEINGVNKVEVIVPDSIYELLRRDDRVKRTALHAFTQADRRIIHRVEQAKIRVEALADVRGAFRRHSILGFLAGELLRHFSEPEQLWQFCNELDRIFERPQPSYAQACDRIRSNPTLALVADGLISGTATVRDLVIIREEMRAVLKEYLADFKPPRAR